MIQIDHITVNLPGFSLEDICLTVENGEFFSLLGPTGAGKTLILELIAGLVLPSKGRVKIADRDVTRLPPEKRGVGIVYQDHALFPHLSVRDNIRFGLRYHRKSGRRSDLSLEFLIGSLGLSHLLGRFIHNLSGGEKQRVALARALAIDPAVLLLDEPLSSLDPNFREEIQQLLKRLHRETAITVLMVTHDFTEAHFLAERTAVINRGRIEQVGSVSSVFLKPATPFVAEFVGMKNIFPATFAGNLAKVDKWVFQVNGPGHGHIAIRPEHIKIMIPPCQGQAPNLFEGHIDRVSNQGVYADVVVDLFGLQVQTIVPVGELHSMNLSSGCPVFISIDPRDIHFI